MTVQEKCRKSFELRDDNRDMTKWEWASSVVFGLVTYDGYLDEKLVRKIIEVCKVILNKENYEYIEPDESNYTNYILVCQLLDRNGWLNWGTSIRGAWFEEDSDSKLLIEDEYWNFNADAIGGRSYVDLRVKFSEENLREIINFIESED